MEGGSSKYIHRSEWIHFLFFFCCMYRLSKSFGEKCKKILFAKARPGADRTTSEFATAMPALYYSECFTN
jgi:hypothetical protein